MKEDIDMFEQQNPKYVVFIFQWEMEENDEKKLPVTLIRSPNGEI